MRDINDYASKYVNEPFEDTMVRIRKNMVITQCRKYKHQNILEVGCGISPLFMDLNDFEQMIVVEPGREFARMAQISAKEAGKEDRITVYHAFLENAVEKIKADGWQFDMIVVSSLLHEVDDPAGLLSAVRNLCSEHTVVHINVPNAASMHRLLAFESGLITDIYVRSEQQILMQRRHTFDMEQLAAQVEVTGFRIEDRGSYFVKPFTHRQMQKCLDTGIIDERLLDGLDRLVRYFPEAGAEIYVNARRKNRDHE